MVTVFVRKVVFCTGSVRAGPFSQKEKKKAP